MSHQSPPGSDQPRARRAYIDWLRGVAVVIMIMAHTTDAWTRVADREKLVYILSVRVACMGAPLFLFLAGLSVALSSGAKMRKGLDRVAASHAVALRGLQIFGLAFLFRLQAFLASPGATMGGILKVDILNIMGPAISGAALLWGLSSRAATRVLLFSAVASAFSLLTPLVRAADWLAPLPDAIEAYIRPPQGKSWFALFPWAGLLFAGAAVGVLIDGARDEAAERRVLAWLAWAGSAVALASVAASFFPSPFANTYFWTTGPSYFFARIGVMTAALPAAWLWWRRATAHRWSPMLELGASSLFIYWVHVELAYGIASQPLHRALPVGWAFLAFALFTVAMLLLARVKTRFVARRRNGRRRDVMGRRAAEA